MATSSIKVTQVKLDVRQIIENLQSMETCEINLAKLGKLKCNTEELLSNLEYLPLENLKIKLKRQHMKRKLKRLKKRKTNQSVTTPLLNMNLNPTASSSKSLEDVKDTKTKPHHQLRSLHECQRFLKTFELLEQLHLARSQNPRKTRKFAAQLQQLRSVWNCLLQEQQQEQISKNLKMQQQWSDVLFGPPEKVYFQEKPDLQNFVSKRQIWDSYIDNKHGSCIPTGWILPPSEADEKWNPYHLSTVDD